MTIKQYDFNYNNLKQTVYLIQDDNGLIYDICLTEELADFYLDIEYSEPICHITEVPYYLIEGDTNEPK